MKITKKKALQECVRIWSYLARTGNASKPAYANKYEAACPVCEYMKPLAPFPDGEYINSSPMQDVTYWCNSRCIMKSVWKNKQGCNGPNALFHRWVTSSSPADRKKYAAAIRDGAQKLLDKLNKEEAAGK